MAQECFCGCGREVKGMTTRGMNKQGRRTVEMTEQCREAARTVMEKRDDYTGDPSGMVGVLEDLAKEGDAYVDFWAGVVHDTDVPPPGEARQIKKQWVDWGKRCRPVIKLAGLPPETLEAVIAQSKQ